MSFAFQLEQTGETQLLTGLRLLGDPEAFGLGLLRWCARDYGRVRRMLGSLSRLLESTGWFIRGVAAQVSDAEPSHLARMFRRAHGVSPTQYRRERWS